MFDHFQPIMKACLKLQAAMKNYPSSFLLKTYSPPYLGLIIFVAAMLWAADSRAATVTLAWDASPDPVTSYTVFYGEKSILTNPSTAQPAGTALTCAISELLPGHTYYFAIKAYYNTSESGFSNEVIYTVPGAGSTTTSALSTSSSTTSMPQPSSTTSSFLTTSTSTIKSTTTTTVKKKKKYTILGGMGAASADGADLADTGDQTTFAGQGAIALFEGSDISARLSVAWEEYNALNGEARIATGDIDGDGKEEIIIGLGPVEGNSEIPGGKFQILDDDFTSLGWGRIDWSQYNSSNGESWPACGDINGDGVDEILIGLGVGGNGRVEVFNFKNGQAVHEKWIQLGWEEYCKAGGGIRPACGNINASHRDEIILGLYPVGDIFMPEGKFEVLDGSGRHLAWGVVDWPEYNAINGETRPACGNTDRTMRDEILLGLGAGSSGKIPVYAYSQGKVTLKRWIEAGTSEYRSANGQTWLSCGDTDSDGLDEVLIGFGQGGKGVMELRDDGLHDFSIIASLQMPDEDYNMSNGETYPAIKSLKNKFPRVLDLFLQTVSNENK